MAVPQSEESSQMGVPTGSGSKPGSPASLLPAFSLGWFVLGTLKSAEYQHPDLWVVGSRFQAMFFLTCLTLFLPLSGAVLQNEAISRLERLVDHQNNVIESLSERLDGALERIEALESAHPASQASTMGNASPSTRQMLAQGTRPTTIDHGHIETCFVNATCNLVAKDIVTKDIDIQGNIYYRGKILPIATWAPTVLPTPAPSTPPTLVPSLGPTYVPSMSNGPTPQPTGLLHCFQAGSVTGSMASAGSGETVWATFYIGGAWQSQTEVFSGGTSAGDRRLSAVVCSSVGYPTSVRFSTSGSDGWGFSQLGMSCCGRDSTCAGGGTTTIVSPTKCLSSPATADCGLDTDGNYGWRSSNTYSYSSPCA